MPPSGSPATGESAVILLDAYIDAVPLEAGKHSLPELFTPSTANFSVTGQIPASVALDAATAEANLYITPSVPMSWTTQIPVVLSWPSSSTVSDVIQHVMNALHEMGALSVRNVIAVLLHMRDMHQKTAPQ